jgi:ATP-binding cassette subfamily B protein
MNDRLKKIASLLPYLPRSLRLTWEAAGYWSVAWMGLLVLQGLLPAMSVYLTKLVTDSLVAASQSGGAWEEIQPALVYASIMGAVILAQQVLQSVVGWVRTAQSEHFTDYINQRIQEQAAAVDLAYYESSEYYDNLHRVLDRASTQPLTLLETLGGLIQSGITLLAVAGLLVPYGAWLPLVILLGTIPAFVVLVRYNRIHHDWWMRRTEDRRRAQYCNTMLTNSHYAAEVRLFGLGSYFREQYATIRSFLRHEKLDLEKRQVLARIAAGLLALAVTAGTMLWMGWRMVYGAATLGDLALFYRAFDKGQNLMRKVLSSLSQVHNEALFLEHLFEFLDEEPRVVSPPDPSPVPAPLREGVRFHDVTFSYPAFDEPVLRNLDLEIPTGKTVAIVGENGAGKTTLLKLLTRFYDPTKGAVTLDGVDYRDLPLDELRQQITTLFQFPVQYQATARESIALGDVRKEVNQARVEAAARAAGIHDRIMQLSEAYDTHLGMWFSDGAELSGGEWQRLAMARAFYRGASLVVLDEPTSMMDSWAEAEWFDRFDRLTSDTAALIITHRFTIAKRADIIHVMEDGQIVESGAHDELVSLGGRYQESWERQIASSNGQPAFDAPSGGFGSQ